MFPDESAADLCVSVTTLLHSPPGTPSHSLFSGSWKAWLVVSNKHSNFLNCLFIRPQMGAERRMQTLIFATRREPGCQPRILISQGHSGDRATEGKFP